MLNNILMPILVTGFSVDSVQTNSAIVVGLPAFGLTQPNKQKETMPYDDTKKRAHDSQIVRAKENLKMSYSEPSQWKAKGTNQLIKVLRQGHH